MMKHTVIPGMFGLGKVMIEEFLTDTEIGPYVEITAYDERGKTIRIPIPMEDWQEIRWGTHTSTFTTQQRAPGVPPEGWERWPTTDEEWETYKNGRYRN